MYFNKLMCPVHYQKKKSLTFYVSLFSSHYVKKKQKKPPATHPSTHNDPGTLCHRPNVTQMSTSSRVVHLADGCAPCDRALYQWLRAPRSWSGATKCFWLQFFFFPALSLLAKWLHDSLLIINNSKLAPCQDVLFLIMFCNEPNSAA